MIQKLFIQIESLFVTTRHKTELEGDRCGHSTVIILHMTALTSNAMKTQSWSLVWELSFTTSQLTDSKKE